MLQSSGDKPRTAAVYHYGDDLRAAVMINWPRALGMVRSALQERAPAGSVIDKLRGLIEG